MFKYPDKQIKVVFFNIIFDRLKYSQNIDTSEKLETPQNQNVFHVLVHLFTNIQTISTTVNKNNVIVILQVIEYVN